MRNLIIYTILFTLVPFCTESKTLFDTDGGDIYTFFSKANAKYVIRYEHQFNDTLIIPRNSELFFDGGHLSGPIVFDDTKLSGNIRLQGSSIGGRVKNKTFNAKWLCVIDGETDDAGRINEIIGVCSRVFFPKGIYRLRSAYDAKPLIGRKYGSSVESHIGISKNNVSLTGEEGTVFLTDVPLGTICIFSKPYQLEKSVKGVKIKGITFRVVNNGDAFYEYMHTIKMLGANGVLVEDCVFDDFWGDAICLSHYGDNSRSGERARNQNIKIVNNKIIGGSKHNNRNGISIINGKNV